MGGWLSSVAASRPVPGLTDCNLPSQYQAKDLLSRRGYSRGDCLGMQGLFSHQNIHHNLLGKDAAKFWSHRIKSRLILREWALAGERCITLKCDRWWIWDNSKHGFNMPGKNSVSGAETPVWWSHLCTLDTSLAGADKQAGSCFAVQMVSVSNFNWRKLPPRRKLTAKQKHIYFYDL